MSKPLHWTDVYSQGTPEGDEEQLFFVYLARDEKYQFKTIAQIALETSLSKERVEQIIGKYHKLNMVFQNPKNEDSWGYWEKCPELVPKKYVPISEKSKQKRIEEINKKE